MNRVFVDIVFEGDKFSPTALREATGLRLNPLAEFGQISKRGRFKGQKSPYGLAVLKIEPAIPEDLNVMLNSAIRYLMLEYEVLRKTGVEEVYLDTEYLDDKNLKVSDDIYESLKELNRALKSHKEDIKSNFFKEGPHLVYFDANILQLYSDIFLKDFKNHFLASSSSKEKLENLFVKILESNLSQINFPKENLMSFVMIYCFNYIGEELGKIPSFEEVLKQNLPSSR